MLGWLFLLLATASAEEPPAARDRFAFAEMYLGIDARRLATTVQPVFGPSRSAPPRPFRSVQPRLWVGATHFWGHADIYVAFALPAEVRTRRGPFAVAIGQNVETGAKLYPWATGPNTVRPWVTAGWAPMSYRQTIPGEVFRGPSMQPHGLHLGGGVTGRLGAHAVEVGVGWLGRRVRYPTPDGARAVDLDLLTASFAYKVHFDTTAGNRAPASDGRVEARLDELAQAGRWSGIEVAAGPSSAFTYLDRPDPIEALAGPPGAAIFADLAVGYYHGPTDLVARLAMRSFQQQADGYGVERHWSRRAVGVEVVKMVGDYHGFVPFLGAAASHNRLRVTTTEEGRRDTTQVTPELVFGWDIRPTDTQAFLLRTNLRVAPALSRDFRHLEFNFIQLVLYPQRWF